MSKHPDHGGFDFDRTPPKDHSVAAQIALGVSFVLLACIVGGFFIMAGGAV